jgi:proline dehydrogenase
MLHKLLIRTMPLVPRILMRQIAGKYIAGETQGEALTELTRQAQQGYPGIFDILGEGSGSEIHARAAAASYKEGASAIAEAGLDAYISIKPTHMGLDTSEDLALSLYREVAEHCKGLGVFMRVEMEDHPTTEATLRIFERLRKDFERVGIVLQSRLFRTTEDIASLAPGPLDVRVVKGIYLEPAEIAHTDAAAIRKAYLGHARQLLERGNVRLRFATHDGPMAQDLVNLVEEFDLPKEAYEFQVLLGVQQPLWKLWSGQGHTVRVYVPFGPEWREYSQRRLGKNPDLLKAVMRDMLPF